MMRMPVLKGVLPPTDGLIQAYKKVAWEDMMVRVRWTKAR